MLPKGREVNGIARDSAGTSIDLAGAGDLFVCLCPCWPVTERAGVWFRTFFCLSLCQNRNEAGLGWKNDSRSRLVPSIKKQLVLTRKPTALL